MSENERAYCRICGEGCSQDGPFCADWREVIEIEPHGVAVGDSRWTKLGEYVKTVFGALFTRPHTGRV